MYSDIYEPFDTEQHQQQLDPGSSDFRLQLYLIALPFCAAFLHTPI
jgi:hypothetical protein